MIGKYQFVLFGLIAMVAGCHTPYRKKKVIVSQGSAAPAAASHTSASPALPPVTIFVHGTYPGFVPRPIVMSAFHCGDGFHRAVDIKNASITWNCIKAFSKADPRRFPLETCYAYCWPGNLDFKVREKAAEKLYVHIQNLLTDYEKKYGARPPMLRIIGHSHGCNVALNLARVQKDRSFVIDQLILLAGPVQEATMHLAKDPMFKCVYSFYSTADNIQILDPQGNYKETRHLEKEQGAHVPLFSQRRFPGAPNMRQVKIKLYGRAPMHVEFIRPHFIRHLPRMLDEMDSWQTLITEPDKEHLLKIQRG